MGRKKIKIQPIKEDRNRSVTYLKRKAGLFKKAHELAVLTDSQVAVIVFGHNGKLAEFCSTDIDLLLLRYTEYDGVAERKGPQNYLNLGKDSDDDDDDNDDNAGGDGLDDDLSGSGSGNGGGSASGGGPAGRSTGKISGVKRKAEHASTSNTNSLASSSSVGAGFGAGVGQVGISPSAKQTINAALRQKTRTRASTGDLAVPAQNLGQTAFVPLSFGQTYMPSTSIQPNAFDTGMSNMALMGSASSTADANSTMPARVATGGPSTGSTRAEAIANMSIPMPDQDRVPIFLSPATPGFGMTPNGTVTTPGGRRFSFSDFLTRGSASSTTQRPVTSNTMIAPSFFQNDAFGLSATPPPNFGSLSHSMSPQPSHDASSSAPFRNNASLVSRPASADVLRSTAPTYSEATYAPTMGASMAPGSTLTSASSMHQPFTSSANLDVPHASSHLAPPGASFAPNLHGSSASPVPSVAPLHSNATGINAYSASPFVGSDLKSSATPLGRSQSSATPELISHGKSATPRVRMAASASRSSISTDEETPPGQAGGAGMAASPIKADSSLIDPNAAWLHLGQEMGPKPDPTTQAQGTLVQPVPINATQTLGSVPFDLKLPARRRQ